MRFVISNKVNIFIKQSATIVRGNETVSPDSVMDNPDLGYYEAIYGTCILAILVTSALRSFGLTRASIRASTSLHNRVFAKILASSMQFFETTPRGRIQNIFTRDADESTLKLIFFLLLVSMDSLNLQKNPIFRHFDGLCETRTFQLTLICRYRSRDFCKIVSFAFSRWDLSAPFSHGSSLLSFFSVAYFTTLEKFFGKNTLFTLYKVILLNCN